MKRIALTGGIACGKSELAGCLSDLGCDVLDTDAVVHALEAPGGAAVPLLVEAFGAVVRDAAGGIDRRQLGARVFADQAARQRLNAIVHPLVRKELRRWLAEGGDRPKVAVIPLLFEVGWEGDWDAIVCVACSEVEQRRRLQARGLSADEAQARLAAQMPQDEKIRRSGRTVWNDGTREDLRREAGRLMGEWLENES
jgi:dephospho-CoA kinase